MADPVYIPDPPDAPIEAQAPTYVPDPPDYIPDPADAPVSTVEKGPTLSQGDPNAKPAPNQALSPDEARKREVNVDGTETVARQLRAGLQSNLTFQVARVAGRLAGIEDKGFAAADTQGGPLALATQFADPMFFKAASYGKQLATPLFRMGKMVDAGDGLGAVVAAAKAGQSGGPLANIAANQLFWNKIQQALVLAPAELATAEALKSGSSQFADTGKVAPKQVASDAGHAALVGALFGPGAVVAGKAAAAGWDKTPAFLKDFLTGNAANEARSISLTSAPRADAVSRAFEATVKQIKTVEDVLPKGDARMQAAQEIFKQNLQDQGKFDIPDHDIVGSSIGMKAMNWLFKLTQFGHLDKKLGTASTEAMLGLTMAKNNASNAAVELGAKFGQEMAALEKLGYTRDQISEMVTRTVDTEAGPVYLGKEQTASLRLGLHEMPLAEAQRVHFAQGTPEGIAVAHENAVRHAVQKGEYVPGDVLKQYPELLAYGARNNHAAEGIKSEAVTALKNIRAHFTQAMIDNPEFAEAAGYREGYLPIFQKEGAPRLPSLNSEGAVNPSIVKERTGDFDPLVHETDFGKIAERYANQYARFTSYAPVIPKVRDQVLTFRLMGQEGAAEDLAKTAMRTMGIKSHLDFSQLLSQSLMKDSSSILTELGTRLPDAPTFGAELGRFVQKQVYNALLFPGSFKIAIAHAMQPVSVGIAEIGNKAILRGNVLMKSKDPRHLQMAADALRFTQSKDLGALAELAAPTPNLATSRMDKLLGKSEFKGGLGVADRILQQPARAPAKALKAVETYKRQAMALGAYEQMQNAFKEGGTEAASQVMEGLTAGERIAVKNAFTKGGIDGASHMYGLIRTMRINFIYNTANTAEVFSEGLGSLVPFRTWTGNMLMRYVEDIQHGTPTQLAKRIAVPIVAYNLFRQLGVKAEKANPLNEIAHAGKLQAAPFLDPGSAHNASYSDWAESAQGLRERPATVPYPLNMTTYGQLYQRYMKAEKQGVGGYSKQFLGLEPEAPENRPLSSILEQIRRR